MSPRTYYQILQVDSEASTEVIDAAYRRLARMYHPDVNNAPDALARMQELNHAYDVLKHPDKRSAYDAELARVADHGSLAEKLYGGSRTQTPRQAAPPNRPQTSGTAGRDKPAETPRYIWEYYAEPSIPKYCERCGRSDSSLRLAVFPYVVSLLIVTLRQATSGLYCDQCRIAMMNTAKIKTLVFGWWGIPFGPIYSLGVLFTHSEGNIPADVNGPYLGGLGLHFLKAGKLDEGIATLEASLGYWNSLEVGALLTAAKNYRSGPGSTSRPSGSSAETRNSSNSSTVTRADGGWGGRTALIVIAALLIWMWWALKPDSNTNQYMAANPTTSAPVNAVQSPQQIATDIPATPTTLPKPTVVRQVAIAVDDFDSRSGPGATYAASVGVTKGQALTVVAQQDGCRWLKVETSRGEQGWVRNDRKRVKWDTQCDLIPLGVFRPRTQVLTRSRSSNSYGTLEVENGTLSDAVVAMTDVDNQLLASAYIRAGDTYVISEIPDGSHWLFFSSGSDWDGARFTSAAGYSKFDDPIPYSTTSDSSTGWSITLQPVVGGTAETTYITEESFPAIE